MHKTDDAERMRIRAHQIWEREGCPQGREHEHWAEAARELAEMTVAQPSSAPDLPDLPRDSEIARLRRALYEPAEFSSELFGHEAPQPALRPRSVAGRQGSFASPRPAALRAAGPNPA